jgi:hypothetical protein
MFFLKADVKIKVVGRGSPLLIVLSSFLVGCGSNAIIADRVKYKPNFEKKTVQVSFEMNPLYSVKETRRFNFGNLGVVALKWNTETQVTEVGTLLSGDRDTLSKDWPTKLFPRFPNGKKLPPSVPKGSILEWKQVGEPLSVSLLYQASPLLIAGGAIQSAQFSKLPRKFLATQKFYTKNKDVQATISALGPTENSQGGLFYFANFQVNPFLSSEPDSTEMAHRVMNLEVLLESSGPAEVISWGERNLDHPFRTFGPNFLDCLEPECDIFKSF